jgi:serine phosphatase RsbU (regulator of sigma subunit)/catechol 2,3-dioxygenase-like lactoylglutathione lyase family enzyme
MIKDPDQIAPTDSASDRIVFLEQGIRHSFQFEGADPEPDREATFLRINFVSVYVNDQDRSKKFFLEQLGFKLMIDACFPSGYRWIEVAPPDGSARLALVLPGRGFVDEGLAGRSSLITFMTDDVEGKYREWSERGVQFSMPPHTPEWGGSFCRFEDLDGNPFGLAGFDDVTRALEEQRKAEAQRREARRLTNQELEIAKQVQARLLPQRLPTIPTLDCAGICVQARVVGGDYYDLLELGRDRAAIVVADIAGKGIGAALLMANLQANLRSQCAWAGDHPEQALSLVNRMLFENTEPRAYATLFYAEYNAKEGRLRYANCGHPPGLLLRGDNVEKLEASNTVVGLFEQWDCALLTVSMQNGDILVLYTDGVIEAFDDSGEEFGEKRLMDTLCSYRSLSAPLIAKAIVDQVAKFGGRDQYDDITVVVAKKTA